MSARPSLRLACLLASMLGCACLTEPEEPCRWEWPMLEPGEKPHGIDPQTVFDLYEGVWMGTLDWRSDEPSALTLTSHIDASRDVAYTTWCGDAGRLDQPLIAELKTDDGFAATLTLDTAVRLLAEPEFDPPRVIDTQQVTLGARGEAILAGLTNRDAWRVEVRLFWDSGGQERRATAPAWGDVRALRPQIVTAGTTESIEIATFHFPGD